MGKTRDLFKKIRDTKGTFHAKMGTIKDRNGMDLTEAEDIKRRQQEYTKEPYKKDLHDPDNHNGVITHLEPNVMECKVKWALGSITMNKTSGGNEIPVELFQTTTQLHSSHTLVMFRILQARLQQYVNHELPDAQACFRKGRRTRNKITNIQWIIKKAREFQKNIYFCFIDYAKAFDCVAQ